MKIHIVQKGDTLWKIAKKYGVNFEELKKMNSQLSNPDMIMPGMKVKVPTAGGMIKKETPMGTKPEAGVNLGAKKEVPIAEKPIVKEQPKPLPIKEAPIKEAPIIKEAPKAPYTPKMPISVAPEVDINNYYMMNMANMNVQPQPQPKPPVPPPAPELKEVPKKEVPIVAPPPPIECPPPVLEQPVCEPECVPITPIMPGTGFCPPIGYPLEPGIGYPDYSGGAVPMVAEPMPPNPAAAGTSFFMPQHFDDESSSSYMPQIPLTSPAAFGNPGGAYMGHQPPVQPLYSQPGADPAGGYPTGESPESPMIPAGYPAGSYPQYPAGSAGYAPGGYPAGGYPGYPATPGGYPTGGYPGYPATPGGYPTGGYPGYPATPGGYPTGGYPGYPATPGGYSASMYPGYPEAGSYQGVPTEYGPTTPSFPRNDYLNPAPYGGQLPMQQPYGPMPYGYPQMAADPQALGAGEHESSDLIYGAHPSVQPGGIPVSTGGLVDCGCGEPPAAAQTFVPPTPPIYMAPYTAPAQVAQPPFMNPYGVGPAGYMPRNEEESIEFDG